ncbi:sensor histidine kinase [Sulfurimonas sp.]|uniref:sensor histidine kinase n=1 Tax=Sulfurimonas sp. TaxID=2022749 RepID=UPI003569B7C9
MYKILVIDDVELNLMLMREILTPDYEVITASSAKEGLAMLQAFNIDLILLDISMPDMDGYELIKILKANESTKNIPVIFVSALRTDEHEVLGLELGAVDYILKPIVEPLVKARVATHIQLNEYKNMLEKKVEEEIQKREDQEKLMIQQSKLAAMGEMMDAVAHQWSQPLTIIGLKTKMLPSDYEHNEVDLEYLKEYEKEVSGQITHLTDTLKDFRNFFRPNKTSEVFDMKKMVESSLNLMKDEIVSNVIKISVNDVDNFKINAIENEMKHLVLNLVNNAKDAFNENSIKDRKIDINIYKDEHYNYLEVIDNAGGIPKNIINEIFKAHVTTKEDGKGTGIGLYMSGQIAQKYGAILDVKNVDSGAKFIVKFPIKL